MTTDNRQTGGDLCIDLDQHGFPPTLYRQKVKAIWNNDHRLIRC